MTGTTLPTPLYPDYQAALGFGALVETAVFAVYAAGVIAALLLAGDLSDRVGRRPVLAVGLGMGLLSAICFLVGGGLPWLFAGRVLSGLSAGLITGTATTTLLDLAPPQARGRVSGIATAVNMGGLGLGPVLAGVLAQWLPWRLHLVFAVHLVLLAGALVGLRTVPEPVTPAGWAGWRPAGVRVPAAARGDFLRAGVVVFAGFAVTGLFPAVAPSFLGHVLGVTNRAAVGAVVAVVFVGSIVGQRLAPARDKRRVLAGSGAVVLGGMVLLVLALQLGSATVLVGCALVSGIGQGLGFAAGMARVVASVEDRDRATTASALFLVAYLGISLPVVGLGEVQQLAGPARAGVLFAVVVGLLGGLAGASALRPDRARSRR